MPAPIVYFDIAGLDVQVLRTFYSRIFGWEPNESDQFFVPVEPPLSGSLRADPVEKRIYLGVEDVTATLQEIEQCGGTIDAARFEVPGVAVLGLFRDPVGNPMGLVGLTGGRPKVP
jgi:predicted enzyme related to lactoylglutathione lyase